MKILLSLSLLVLASSAVAAGRYQTVSEGQKYEVYRRLINEAFESQYRNCSVENVTLDDGEVSRGFRQGSKVGVFFVADNVERLSIRQNDNGSKTIRVRRYVQNYQGSDVGRFIYVDLDRQENILSYEYVSCKNDFEGVTEVRDNVKCKSLIKCNVR